MFVPKYTEAEARAVVASSLCYSEVLRKLGLRPAGGNHRVLRKYVDEIWRIPTDHFDANRARMVGLKRIRPVALEKVLVDGSHYSRDTLKRRLFAAGLKHRQCEMCGQGEIWQGLRMALILDHINGVPDDNRLENLRIVCPNCAATFDTHCGRKNRLATRNCLRCAAEFVPRNAKQRYCSLQCGTRYERVKGGSKPQRRKVSRPSYEQLKADLASMSFVATGQKYGVSDNAVRKWLRWYAYRESTGQTPKEDVTTADAQPDAA